jgi:hypothetical protein
MNYLKLFNEHFEEFLNDVHSIFPENLDVLTAKNSLMAIRKANPKLVAKVWVKYVLIPYREQIEAGDIGFFLEKDYTQDVKENSDAENIIKGINRIRNPIKEMETSNQHKAMKYIQNLCKLASLATQT